MLSAIRGPWTIAVYTWREGMRKKTLIGFLILSLLVIFGSTFLTNLLSESYAGEVETDVEAKLIKDICVTTISIFGVLITIFISASVVPTEMENKVIYTVLSKPVRWDPSPWWARPESKSGDRSRAPGPGLSAASFEGIPRA